MNRTELFAYLRAPLANTRWSWGAVRPDDGAVFLQVWQDEHKKIDGKPFTCVNSYTFFGEDLSNLGHAERLRHVDLIRAGAPSFMIMCRAADPKASPRVIASIDDKDVFVGGRLVQFDGDWWLERAARINVSAVAARP
jgi:hypothetical protein